MALHLKCPLAASGLTLICLISSSCAPEEPFSWEDAIVTNHTITSNNDFFLSYSAGFISKEQNGDLKIRVDWAGADNKLLEQDLVRTVAGGSGYVKSIKDTGTAILVRWPKPQSIEAQSNADSFVFNEQCWRLNETDKRFVEIECPPVGSR